MAGDGAEAERLGVVDDGARDADRRFLSFGVRLLKILGSPSFSHACAEPMMCFRPQNLMQMSPDELKGMDDEEIRTFQALIRVAYNLANSGSALAAELELSVHAQSWDRLISEFGMDESDIHTLRAYAHPDDSSLGEDQLRDQEEVQRAHLAFTDYDFKGEAHIKLHQQLRERREEASMSKHYSPYVALVQASGVGKSRALMQMSSLEVYICYCSLAGRYSSASPPRTGRLADKLAETFHEHDMVLYLKAWLRVLDESICKRKSEPDAWKEQQLPKKDGSPKGDIAERVCTTWESLLLDHKNHSYENNGDRDAANIVTCRPEVTAIKQHLKDRTCAVMFVFDEARGLQIEEPKTKSMSKSPFYQIRRALRVFFTEKLFFAVFVDTAAKVSNPLPTKANEDSERALQRGQGLLTPIYCLPNINLNQPTEGLTAQEYWRPDNWLMYGRPLWAARCRKHPPDKKLLSFAQQKLLCTLEGVFDGKHVDVEKGKMTQSQAIALLSAAAGLSICARSMLAERLAASHMNLILRVTEEMKERRIYVGLSAEPILAEAAGSILQHVKVQEEALKHLEKAYLAGYVTPGPRGEFVTKFILVAAVWHLKQEWILQPIPVDQFLVTLLDAPTDADKELCKQVKAKCPEGGFVFFNSFVIIRRSPTTADLGRAFAAGHALMYIAENRLPGVDIIIPVWTSNGMTAILVSAKNVQNAGWLTKESVAKVKSEYTHVEVAEGLPSITVVMSVREPQMTNSENWVLWNNEDPAYIHLSCYGIDRNYSFLKDAVKKLLKKLLVTVPDELSDATDKEIDLIKEMIPEQFRAPHSTYSKIPADSTVSDIPDSTDSGIPKKRRKIE